MAKEISGEAFLDKIYPGLHTSEEVLHTEDKSKTNAENIERYLNRINKVHNHIENNHQYRLVLNYYYNKYVVKEEDIDGSKLVNGITKEEIIESQKKSLKEWISYLSSDGAQYPLWAKYWVFQGMLKIGNYNEKYDPKDPKTGKAFTSRSKHTLTPFIECNPELIAQAIYLMNKYNNGKELNDEEIEKVVKTGSFSKIYGILQYQYKESIKNRVSNIDGVWIKYNKGSKEDAIRLSKSLNGYCTHWCTAAEEMAIRQVCGPYDHSNGGDFYVYYSYDNEGVPRYPRIAIRMNGTNEIGEIRGIEKEQNLELSMISILEKKLNEIENLDEEDKERALETINNLKILDYYYSKYKSGEELTSKEIVDYIDFRTGGRWYSFGWEDDERYSELDNLPIYKLGNKEAKYNKDVIWSAVHYYKTIKYIPKDIENYDELIHDLLVKHPSALSNLPDEKINYEYVLDILKETKCFFRLKIQSPKVKDLIMNNRDLLVLAVKCSGANLLELDSKSNLYKEICFECANFDNNSNIMEHVDKKVPYYKDLIIKALQKDPGNLIIYLGKYNDYEELLEKTIIKFPTSISFTPNEYIKKHPDRYNKLKWYAVSKDFNAISCLDKFDTNDNNFELIKYGIRCAFESNFDGYILENINYSYANKEFSNLSIYAAKINPDRTIEELLGLYWYYEKEEIDDILYKLIDIDLSNSNRIIKSTLNRINDKNNYVTYDESLEYEWIEEGGTDEKKDKSHLYKLINDVVAYITKDNVENIKYVPLEVELPDELNIQILERISNTSLKNKENINEYAREMVNEYRKHLIDIDKSMKESSSLFGKTITFLNGSALRLLDGYNIQRKIMQLKDKDENSLRR